MKNLNFKFEDYCLVMALTLMFFLVNDYCYLEFYVHVEKLKALTLEQAEALEILKEILKNPGKK